MSDNSNKVKNKIRNFPDSPGVYIMKGASGDIIYIGKATSLKKRVYSYFSKALDNKTEKLISEVADIGYRNTASAVEALILEANLVSKYMPKYNIKLKDDKSFANIMITDEKYPRIIVARPTDRKKPKARYVFGPYLSKDSALQVVDFLIRTFDPPEKGRGTSSLYRRYYMKGYSSGKIEDISLSQYARIISNIRLFLEGRRERILRKLKRGMEEESKKMNFENAGKIRNTIFALEHIRDIAFIKREDVLAESFRKFPHRAECYDISNISGELSVGSMAVFTDGKPDKGEYRKFRIKKVSGTNDIAMLKEVLERRFRRSDWSMPDLVVIDGGLGQKNMAQTVIGNYGLKIPIISIAKGPSRKGEKLFFSASRGFIFPDLSFIKRMRDEAHRFAINYHRSLRKLKRTKKNGISAVL